MKAFEEMMKRTEKNKCIPNYQDGLKDGWKAALEWVLFHPDSPNPHKGDWSLLDFVKEELGPSTDFTELEEE